LGKLSRVYLRGLCVFGAVSCLGLLFLPRELGDRTPWGAAPGWQREIAFWNLSMYILVVRTLHRGDAISVHRLVLALVVLNLLVAANHFAAVMHGSGASLNAVAGALNLGCGTLGLVALWRERIASPTPIGVPE